MKSTSPRLRITVDGQRLRKLRCQRYLTQEELADMSGISARTIQRMEAGGYFRFKTLLQVASILGSDVSDFCRIEAPDLSS